MAQKQHGGSALPSLDHVTRWKVRSRIERHHEFVLIIAVDRITNDYTSIGMHKALAARRRGGKHSHGKEALLSRKAWLLLVI